MKRATWLLICIALLVTGLFVTPACAYSDYSDYPLYMVESYQPNGYCYLYDQPSDVYGNNLGRYDNGSLVRLINMDYGKHYAYVYTADRKLGYMHDYVLTPYEETVNREKYKVLSMDPCGYCYMYDRPSNDDWESQNLSDEIKNGDIVEMDEWYAGNGYAKVYYPKLKKYGYIRQEQLVEENQFGLGWEEYKVFSMDPSGYCYLYDHPSNSDYDSNNLGRYENGASVKVIRWNAGNGFAWVYANKKYGFIRQNQLIEKDRYQKATTNRERYAVYSTNPSGYCYMYDHPSNSDYDSNNLGRLENGEIVEMVDWYASRNGFAQVYSAKYGKYGYIRQDQLIEEARYREVMTNREKYVIYSTNPSGYCYMYDHPSNSDYDSVNLGQFNNGEVVEMVDWYAGNGFAQVYSPKTRMYGYIRQDQLVMEDNYPPVQEFAVVNSAQPRGYCYQYDQPSDIYGQNMGRHENGEYIIIINWDADTTYALVQCCNNNQIGYIRKTCLTRLQ